MAIIHGGEGEGGYVRHCPISKGNIMMDLQYVWCPLLVRSD